MFYAHLWKKGHIVLHMSDGILVCNLMSAQYLLTPLLESCPNLVQWIPLESRFQVKGQGWTADLYPKCYLLTAGLCTIVVHSISFASFALKLSNLVTYPMDFQGMWLTADLHSLSISNDSLIVSYQTCWLY